MPNTARVGDKASMNCPEGASGTITSGSPDVTIGGHNCARVGDIVTCDSCGASCPIITGSVNSLVNDKGIARVGDSAHGTCIPTGASITPTITTGDPNTITN